MTYKFQLGIFVLSVKTKNTTPIKIKPTKVIILKSTYQSGAGIFSINLGG
jgi:hypothetical protein